MLVFGIKKIKSKTTPMKKENTLNPIHGKIKNLDSA